jgi:hypothetical protein
MGEKERQMDAFYGPDLKADKAALAAIEARQEQGGTLYRLSGQAGRDQEAAQRLRLSIADGERRRQESIDALRADQAQERALLEERHARERTADERRIVDDPRAGSRPPQSSGPTPRSQGSPASPAGDQSERSLKDEYLKTMLDDGLDGLVQKDHRHDRSHDDGYER